MSDHLTIAHTQVRKADQHKLAAYRRAAHLHQWDDSGYCAGCKKYRRCCPICGKEFIKPTPNKIISHQMCPGTAASN